MAAMGIDKAAVLVPVAYVRLGETLMRTPLLMNSIPAISNAATIASRLPVWGLVVAPRSKSAIVFFVIPQRSTRSDWDQLSSARAARHWLGLMW
jgi:hypothetical protein